MEPETVALRRLIVGYRISQALFVAAKLGIADALSEGPQSIEDLARQTGVDPSALHRMLRLLASEGVFAETEARAFELTPLAAALRRDAGQSLRARAIFDGEPANWQSWGDLLHSVTTGGSAFDHTFGMGIFDYLRGNPDAAAAFNDLMSEQTRQAARAVATAYDFSGSEMIVDVGGGHGGLLAAILQAHPQARGVLFDLPQVIEGARAHVRAAGIDDRCESVEGSFFEAVPAGGDVYALKYVLHDWRDERCSVILRNCRRAMSSSGRLLVIEVLISPGNDPDYGKYLDMNMLVLLGGHERTEDEFRRLFAAAGFELSRVVATGTELAVIEAVPAT